MSHQIRLAGPWEFSLDGVTWERCVLPFAQPSAAADGRGVIRRRFHRPTGLDDLSVVSLVVTATVELPDLELNGNRVCATAEPTHSAEGSTSVFEVTQSLIPFNTLILPVVSDRGVPQQIAFVSLQITESEQPT